MEKNNSTLHRRTFLKQLGVGVAGIGLAPTWHAWSATPETAAWHLPRSTPEAQGIASGAIVAFLDAIKNSKHEFHSFMLVRNGHVIADGWWPPYRVGAPHTLYSLSKSFVSTAVGFAIAEGRLGLNDPVTSIFPEYLPDNVSENLAALRIKHLLTMSVGHGTDSMPIITKEQNWVKAFLAQPIVHEPGTAYLYDSGASYMLSAIVQKVTAQRLMDYLRPRLFEPLDIREMTWETCPRGINTGGWGLSLRTESIAKFGQFYLQRGAWNGRQLLPTAWVDEATSFKIRQNAPKEEPDLEKAKLDNDYCQGYCYQFWRCLHNSYRGTGAYGQLCVVMPDQNAVVAITCETGNSLSELALIWDILLPAMSKSPLPPDKSAEGQLRKALAALAIPVPDGNTDSPVAAKISGKSYKISSDAAGARNVSLRFHGRSCVFTLKDAEGENQIQCGFGKWVDGVTSMPAMPPKITVGDLRPCKVAAAAAWRDENTLEMVWRFYETAHSEFVTCHFDGDKITVEYMDSIARKSSSHAKPNSVLEGVAIRAG